MTTDQKIDPLRACKEAKDDLERAGRELAQMGSVFSTLGRSLQERPVRLMLANTQGTEFSAPLEIGMARSVPSVDYKAWPEKEVVATKLKAYYDAQHVYQNMYNGLPEGERDLFPPPGSN